MNKVKVVCFNNNKITSYEVELFPPNFALEIKKNIHFHVFCVIICKVKNFLKQI